MCNVYVWRGKMSKRDLFFFRSLFLLLLPNAFRSCGIPFLCFVYGYLTFFASFAWIVWICGCEVNVVQLHIRWHRHSHSVCECVDMWLEHKRIKCCWMCNVLVLHLYFWISTHKFHQNRLIRTFTSHLQRWEMMEKYM